MWTHSSVGAGALQAVPFPGCDTVYATYTYAVAKNGNRPAVGTRALLKVRHACHCWTAQGRASPSLASLGDDWLLLVPWGGA